MARARVEEQKQQQNQQQSQQHHQQQSQQQQSQQQQRPQYDLLPKSKGIVIKVEKSFLSIFSTFITPNSFS